MKVDNFDYHNNGQNSAPSHYSDRHLNRWHQKDVDLFPRKTANTNPLPALAAGLMAVALPGAVLSLLFGANPLPPAAYTAHDSPIYMRPLCILDDEQIDILASRTLDQRIVTAALSAVRSTARRSVITPSAHASATTTHVRQRASTPSEKPVTENAYDALAKFLTESESIDQASGLHPTETEALPYADDVTSSSETTRSNAIVVDLSTTDTNTTRSSASATDKTKTSDTTLLLSAEEARELTPNSTVNASQTAGTTQAQTSQSTKSKDEWPSKSESAFNYASPTKTWASNPKMGAGENYPNINKNAVSATDATQGIAGPKASFAFDYPVKKPFVTSYFGWRKLYGRIHYGIDLRAAMDTPVYASARGTVTWYTKPNGGGSFGRVIELHHGEGFTTIYAHMNKVLVASGDHVEKGDLIGYSGNSGTSSPHLHFEIRHKGIAYNPFLGYMALPE